MSNNSATPTVASAAKSIASRMTPSWWACWRPIAKIVLEHAAKLCPESADKLLALAQEFVPRKSNGGA